MADAVTIRPEYDPASLGPGVRGKYAGRLKGTTLVALQPEVAQAFPTSEAVNEALRAVLRITGVVRRSAPARRRAVDHHVRRRGSLVFVETFHRFYARRGQADGAGPSARTGAVTVLQRTSSDLRLNPHVHLLALDGAWSQHAGDLTFEPLGHLQTSEVGKVLDATVRRIDRYLRRRRLVHIGDRDGGASEADPESTLAASAVSGQAPPAGPQWLQGLQPLVPFALAFDKPLRASRDGFTLHAATRAGALDPSGREALLRYVLRPPLAQQRLLRMPDGLVRIVLKKAYPLPHRHLRRRARPRQPLAYAHRPAPIPDRRIRRAAGSPRSMAGYRPWAELLARTSDERRRVRAGAGSRIPRGRTRQITGFV